MGKLIDLTGKKFGRLVVLYYIKESFKWHCRCDCGNFTDVKSSHLRKGLINSCGCFNKERTSISVTKDLTGKRFGKLLVIKRNGTIKGRAAWLCHCDCGKDVILKSTNLLNYGTKSCGCLRSSINKLRMSQDLCGKQFGDLTVISRDNYSGKWLCECKCGNKVLVKTSSLNNGRKINCGCIKKYSITYRKNYYNDIFLGKWKDYVIPLFNQEEYVNCQNLYKKIWKWKCVKCGEQFQSYIYSTGFNKQISNLPRCLKCFPFISGFSFKEKEVLDFIQSIYHDQICQNNRNLIFPQELDIYLPEKKFAIEFDGLFWHSNKDKNYHLMKTELCEKQGIQLIHIFQDEWNDKNEIIQDRIKSILGIDRIRIFARKCIVKEISSKESNNFLDINHIQGGDNSKYHYGLYYNNELVAVMTFGKPRFNKNYDYELIRFASKIGYQVIGGASKLLKYFRNLHNGSIISYADRRYSNGKLYESIGFKCIRKSNPNYYYFKNNKKYSRYNCQKHKLKNILGEKFDQKLSEKDNMINNGFNIIYDCGNLIYIIK